MVGRVRRLLGTRKVGHAGTLDPMATGVLLVGVNQATRLLGHLMLTRKGYTATIRLGVGTVTDDAEGSVTQAQGLRELDLDTLEAALVPLRGDILQVPTAVSAIKVDGVRSYARVRSGEAVSLVPRPVTVYRLEVRAQRQVVAEGVPCLDLDMEVECSSGTYVRALARDLGSSLGSAGHLTALRRTRVGPFDLAESVVLPPAPEPGAVPAALPLLGLAEVARRAFATVAVTAEQAADIGYGRSLPDLQLASDPTALLSPEGDLLALYRPSGVGARPVAVLA